MFNVIYFIFYKLIIYMKYEKYTNYVVTLIILMGFGALYNRYKEKFDVDDDKKQNDMIKKYLLQDDSLAIVKKPLLWIHVEHVPNARFWDSFSSRTTDNFNQPYQFLTIKSIVDKCSKSFNIVFVDDDSFSRIIPEWKHNMSILPDPIKSYFRELAMSKLLYLYGGIIVPASTICIKNLEEIYYRNTANKGMFIGEFYNRTITNQSGGVNFFPHTRFMGCERENESMKELINYIELVISQDNSNEINLDGKLSRKCFELIKSGKVKRITTDLLGGVDANNKIISIEDLMGNTFFNLPETCSLVYIPADEILKRTSYQWFARLSTTQVIDSNTMIGKLLLLNA